MGKRDTLAVQRELKVAPHYVKSIDGRTVTGIFAVHGNIDGTGDRGWPGMFNKTWADNRDNIRGLWQHDGTAPPVMTLDALVDVARADLPPAVLAKAPDATGGAVITRTYLDTPRGQEILTGIQAGAITQMSYMYDVVRWDEEENPAAQEPGVYARPIRNLREVRLWDISDVNWGANPATVASKRAVWLLPDALVLAQVQALLYEIKEGRRNATGDQQMINDMHDLCVKLGANNCQGSDTMEPDADDEGKASRAAVEALTRTQRMRLLDLRLRLAGHGVRP